jgi:hypothetical protein
MTRPACSIRILMVGCAVALSACQPSSPPPEAPKAQAPAESAPAASAPAAPPVAITPDAAPPRPAVAMPAADPPPGPLYYCEVGGARVAVEYEARVDDLCRRHPQMGPCQHEREACRARGGSVFTARDEEVTPAVEAEYDRVVRRVRFQADSAPPR